MQRRGDPGHRRDHRDRHGRGMRGPLARPPVPIARTRAEDFTDVVHAAVRRVERHLTSAQEGDTAPLDLRVLRAADVLVVDVPPADPDPDDLTAAGVVDVPLGRVDAAERERAGRLVVYRRPIEVRSDDDDERDALVQDVVVELVAELLDADPDDVDPDGFDPDDLDPDG